MESKKSALSWILMNRSINGDRAALGIFFKGLMVFEQMLDSPDKGGYMLMAEEGIIEVGSFKAADHAAAVIGIVDHAHREVNVFLRCLGDELAEIHSIEKVGGGVVVETITCHRNNWLAEGEEVNRYNGMAA